ncbi:NACHT domain-containing protein [Nocardia fusca]|uniref:NACHT domain-containing protein n=1 Tax=Nocardia fusca TaxID=941183 RepID=A0ABV3FKE4_9NOCA
MAEMGGGFFRLLGALVRPLMLLYRWWRPVSDRASIAVLSDELSAAVQRVERRLQRELRASGHDFMPVEFTTTARPVGDAGPVAVADIATYFELLGQPEPYRRRLVVLGAPGSGKTVAATYLVLGLLEARQDRDDAPRANLPVPVRVNAAGWDGKQDFARWLIVRLGYDYRLRPNVAREMVERGLILPVIDGLDEMDTDDSAGSRARALLDRLNRAPWRDRPVIVMCRTAEFSELIRERGDNGLHGGTTLTLHPLDTDTVGDYLTSHQDETGTGHPGWTRVITHITAHPDGALATSVRNPWMLGLTAATLHHTPHIAGRLIACTTETAVRDLLFTAQIPAAVAATDEGKPYRDYTEDNVEEWVRALARCLQRRRDEGRNGTAIRLDEIWEIASMTRIRILHGLALALTFGPPFGLTVGAVIWLELEGMVGVVAGLVAGLIAGAVFGIVFGIIRFPRPRRMVWNASGPSRWRRGLKAGTLAGVMTGVAIGVMTGVAIGFTRGLAGGFMSGIELGVLFGLVAGMVYGVVTGLQVDASQELALVIDERRIIHDITQAAAVATIAGWLVFAMAGGFLVGLRELPDEALSEFPLTVATVTGILLVPGAAVGLGLGAVTGLAAGRFYLAALVFRFTKAMPRRPALFLDWARRSGLLRVNGTAYQFRHETYQQWIQQPHSGDPGPPAPTGSNDRMEQPVS